jgi:hypothetical protein
MRYVLITLTLLLPLAPSGFGQAASIPVDVFFPHIAIGGDPGGQNFVTLIQIVNNNSADITGHLDLIAENGSALSAQIDGDSQSTLDFTLASGQARQIQVTLDGDLTSGWMHIGYSPSDPLTTVILQYRSGTALLSEVGVDPQFGGMLSTDFAIETDQGLDTGIAIVNPSNTTAYVLATMWDPSTGAQSLSKVITLPPNGHIAEFVTQLFSDSLTISQIRAKISLDSCSSSTCNFQGGNGFLATAIRLHGDQFTTVPLDERLPGGNLIRILPQIAFGGDPNGLNMKTVLETASRGSC